MSSTPPRPPLPIPSSARLELVRRSKRGPLGFLAWHYGIRAGGATRLPTDHVVDFHPEGLRLCALVSFDSALDGESVLIASNSQLLAAHQRMQQLWRLNPPFDLLSRNCEHVGRFILTGEARSEQIEVLGLIGFFGAIAMLARE